jgi:hypothetical protein
MGLNVCDCRVLHVADDSEAVQSKIIGRKTVAYLTQEKRREKQGHIAATPGNR